MSLFGILNIGSSALAVQQAALQVTGNNLANAADPNYAEETVEESPGIDAPSGPNGQLLGSGVSIDTIQRQVDLALQERLNGATSDSSSASTLQSWAGQIQSTFNALSGTADIGTQINTFFQDWSTLAGTPGSAGQQAVVIQDGQSLADSLNDLSGNLGTISTNLQQAISQDVQQVNQLTSQIATLNGQITAAQGSSSSQANSLLDQRDADLNQLSTLANVQTSTQPNGSVDVFLGGQALISGTSSQSLNASTYTNNGHIDSQVTFASGATATITSGEIGGMLQSQQLVDSTTDSVNSLASNLISAVNNIYSSGQGSEGYSTVTGSNAVLDPTQPLSSSASGLSFPVNAGSFTLTQTNSASGQPTQTTIYVNQNTTLTSLVNNLNGISGIQASVNNNGQLTIQSTDPDVTFSFSNDSSGVLSALGINTFFTGSNASNIGVNSQVASNPSLLASSSVDSASGTVVAGGNANAIGNLVNTPLSSLNGASIGDSYDSLIETIGSAAASATNNASTASTVQQSLQAQEQTLSGVSTDQEALNMIVEQRSYESAAEFISTINTMMQTLLTIT
ncbi:MAG TPA: flagellar hook-associated protein FlgK [Tepidisphaeraceae bacterium]|nr:flagellar hook-associated protein FlgK [Tepidisphaeraceae bacterium]